jgi:hypothetical protein
VNEPWMKPSLLAEYCINKHWLVEYSGGTVQPAATFPLWRERPVEWSGDTASINEPALHHRDNLIFNEPG